MTALPKDLALSPAEMADRAADVATLLKTLSHPARLMIVCTLVEGSSPLAIWRSGSICTSRISPSTSPCSEAPALSIPGAMASRFSTG